MRIKVKKFLGILLSIVLVWGLMPWTELMVKAEQDTATLAADTLYVAGVDITTDEDDVIDSSVPGVTGTATLTYEDGIPVLTLSNFNYSGTGETISDKLYYGKTYAGICYLGRATLVIRLSGINVIGINNKGLDPTPSSAYGIYSNYSDGIVEIESDDNGSLSVTSTNAYRSASNRTPIWVSGTLVMKSGTILTNSNTENPVNSGIARGMYIGEKLNYYGGTIKSTGSPIMTDIRYDGVAFCFNRLVIQQGITPVVKCGETESNTTEMENPIDSNAFRDVNANNTYHYASISAPDYREPVSFIYAAGAGATCSLYNIVTSNTTEWSSGWYVVNKDTTISRKIVSSSEGGTVNIASGADVNLILCDGVKLTITDTDMGSTCSHPGIKLPENSTLNIYGQGTTNPGELDVSYGGDVISRQEFQITGGGSDFGGNVVINGGKLTFNGGSQLIKVKTFTVNAGIVNVQGGSYCAIRSTNVFVNGGEVTAIASVKSDPCISGSVIVNGGKLIAQGGGGTYGNGIGGTITLGDGMYLYGGEDEASAVQMDTTAKAKYMRIDNTPPYKALDMTGDTTPVTIQKGGSALSGAPVVDDVLTVVCPATDLVYEWFIDGISQGTASADKTSYAVTAADFGKTIKVKVYQTKNSEGTDYAEGDRPSKESATTAEVIKTDAQIATEVKNMIIALPYPSDVNLDAKAAIEAASAAYEALTDTQKALVDLDLVNKLNSDIVALAMREVSPKTGSEATYSGQTIQLVNAPTTSLPTGYSMYYAIGDNTVVAPDYDIISTAENKKWNSSVPTETDAGIYYVWYTVVDGDAHDVCPAECVSVTIAKANSQSAIVNPLDRIYDGTEQPLVTVNQAKLQNKLMTLRRMLTPSTFEEFVDEEQEDKQDTEKDAQKSDATDESKSEEVKDTQNNSDDEELTEETKNSSTDDQIENDNDEKGEQKDSELNEEKIIKNSMLIKEILTPTDVDTEDNQQEENDDKELEEKADKDVESEETADETKEKSVDEKSDDETEAYSEETKESKQESETTKEETQEESTATTEENDEKPVVLKAMRTVRLLKTTPTEDPGLKFALGSDSQVEPTDGWSADIPKARNAGTYYVWYKVEGDANHYGTEAACTTVIISKATATVTAKNQTITVGDTVPTLDSSDLYTVSGLFGEDELIKAPSLNYQKNGESVEPDNTKAASYDIVPSGASAGENYNITYEKGTLKISESASAVAEIVPSEEPTSIIAKDPEISNELAQQAEKMAENGDKVELKLVVAPKGESNVTESEVLTQAPQVKHQLESQFKEENTVKIDVVDIDIKQIINGATQENLKETNAVLEIAIGYDFTGKYDPVVIRDHEGNAKAFRALDARPSGNYEDGTFFADVENNVIYLYSRYFSTYVIAYSTVEGNATNREPVVTTTSGGEISQPEVSTIPVYRLFNLKKGYHFFTANAAEKDALVAAGWTDEGVAWQVQPNAGAPVYRLFDKAKGMHIFTVDVAERDACIAAGASDEGIAWHAPTNVGRTVYKITNPKVNRVLYTISAAEKDALVATGFTVEKAKFKAY